MATIREATQQDIEGIAALFNSDPNYNDPWFNTPGNIRSHDEQLRRFNLESITQLVAIDGKDILGYIAAEQFYLTDPALPNGKVAEVKKVFVKPGHRGQGISSKLVEAAESKIKVTGYDFAIAEVVCGHPNSQNLFINNGYMATGFAPNFINADFTKTSPRESLLYVVKAISDFGKSCLESRRVVYVPPETLSVLVAAYSAAGLSPLRSVVVYGNTRASDEEVKRVERRLREQGGENPAEQPTLPLDSVDIAKPEIVSRVKAYVEAGYVPVGVLPIGTDRIIMMHVPNGLSFNTSNVQIPDKAKLLAVVIDNLIYDLQADRS